MSEVKTEQQATQIAREVENIFQRAWMEARQEETFDDAFKKYMFLLKLAIFDR